MDDQDRARRQLVEGLTGEDVHMSLEEAVAEFPDWAINQRPPNVSYTPWHLLEHIRLQQWDILEYIRNPDHVSPDWPVGYWPNADEQARPKQFRATIDGFLADVADLTAIALDPATDLYGPMPHAPLHTIF